VVAVVKADAYGHGAPAVARALAEAGCRRFAVVAVEEAEALRRAGCGASVLVLGGVHDAEEAELAAELDLEPVVHHAGHVELLGVAARRAGRPIPVQLEVDTGMRRMGVREEDAAALLRRIRAAPGLRLEGLFSHLAHADEADLAPTRRQLERFRALLDELDRHGLAPGHVHVANSAGVLAAEALAEAGPRAPAVRVGLALYGVLPAPHRPAPLRPVMTLATRVVHVRPVRAGETVGYGGAFQAARDTRVATLPVGYADGLPRALGNRGVVLLAGRRLPLVGRVSMDYATVDVGDEPVAVGDEAVVFGRAAGTDEVLPVEEQAEAAGTIAYELLVRVGPRVPRVPVDEPDAPDDADDPAGATDREF